MCSRFDVIERKYITVNAGQLFQDSDKNAMRDAMYELQMALVESAMVRCHGNKLQASKILGVSRNTMDKLVRMLSEDLKARSKERDLEMADKKAYLVIKKAS